MNIYIYSRHGKLIYETKDKVNLRKVDLKDFNFRNKSYKKVVKELVDNPEVETLPFYSDSSDLFWISKLDSVEFYKFEIRYIYPVEFEDELGRKAYKVDGYCTSVAPSKKLAIIAMLMLSKGLKLDYIYHIDYYKEEVDYTSLVRSTTEGHVAL